MHVIFNCYSLVWNLSSLVRLLCILALLLQVVQRSGTRRSSHGIAFRRTTVQLDEVQLTSHQLHLQVAQQDNAKNLKLFNILSTFHTSRADCAFGIVSFSSGGSVLAGLADSGMYPVRECARRKLAELGLGAGGSLHSSMLTLDGTALYLLDFHSAFTGS